MSDSLSISKIAGDTTTKAVDLINKFKYNKQVAATNQGHPSIGQLLGNYSQYSTDAACGRTNNQ